MKIIGCKILLVSKKLFLLEKYTKIVVQLLSKWLAGLHLLCAFSHFTRQCVVFSCLCSLPVDLLNIVLHSEPQVYTQVLCIYVLGGGLKIFSAVFEGGPKFLHKSENSIKYLRMSSTPSPARISDPSLISSILNFRACEDSRPVLVFVL